MQSTWETCQSPLLETGDDLFEDFVAEPGCRNLSRRFALVFAMVIIGSAACVNSGGSIGVPLAGEGLLEGDRERLLCSFGKMFFTPWNAGENRRMLIG
jgi:hypothetical protein